MPQVTIALAFTSIFWLCVAFYYRHWYRAADRDRRFLAGPDAVVIRRPPWHCKHCRDWTVTRFNWDKEKKTFRAWCEKCCRDACVDTRED